MRRPLGLLLFVALSLPVFAQSPPPDPTHLWVGATDAAAVDRWVNWHIGEEKRLVAEMLTVKGPRTPENTLTLYDQATMHLTLASNQTGVMFQVHPNEAIRNEAQKMVQAAAAESNHLALDRRVFDAIKAIDLTGANAATRHYLERILLEYRLAGVDKDEATRASVRELQDRITATCLKFSRNVQDDVGHVTVAPAELAGLPADYRSRHKVGADGKVTLTTDAPDYNPVMSYAKSAKLRRAMYLAYNQRAYPVNKQVLLDLLQQRQDLATTLGYPHWADLATADMMIGSAANVTSLLHQVDVASKGRAVKEFALLRNFVQKRDPKALPLTLSDGAYWAEQYKRERYDFNSQSVRPYFPYEEVEKGVLATASRLFRIEFRPAQALVWDPSVHAYDVFDGGAKCGRIYLDMHPRAGKDKWFSESGLVPGQRDQQLPEASLVCNFSGGVAGDPGLMQFNEVVVFFHEFGHMMHEVLGGRQRWVGQSGVTTEGDFVEAPSQMLEEMFHDPTILQSFAKHYQTHKVLPRELIDRMNRASYYGRASWTQGQLFYANYALQLHNRDPKTLDLDALLRQDCERYNPLKFVDGNRMYATFTHLTGYSSNYYTYVLDKVIAVDFFAAFDPKNLLDGPTALRYRKTVLEPGSSKPAAELVKDFLGRPQSIDALKKWMDKEFETP